MNTEVAQEQAAVAEVEQDLFVTVPETTLPGSLVVPAFQVAKYMASEGRNTHIQIDGVGAPLVNVNYHSARTLCEQAGYALITESQALSLAFNLSQCARNWISGTVGDGSMYQGLHLDLDDADECKPFDFVSPDASERREFYLPDGSMVLDAAGNVYSWVFDDVQGDEQGLVARAFAADSPSITTAPYPSMERGIGWQPPVGRDWSGRALLRGGYWCSSGYAGVFYLDSGWPDYGYDYVGVRCTKPIGL